MEFTDDSILKTVVIMSEISSQHQFKIESEFFFFLCDNAILANSILPIFVYICPTKMIRYAC